MRPVTEEVPDNPDAGWGMTLLHLAAETRPPGRPVFAALCADRYGRCQELAITHAEPTAPPQTTALRHRIATLFKRS